MTRKLWIAAATLLLLGSVPSVRAQSPDAALDEIATADKIETVIKHLPVKVEEYIQKLPKQERDALAEKLLVAKDPERVGGKLVKSSDGNSWEVIDKDGKLKVSITVKKSFISGDDALVQLEIQTGEPAPHSAKREKSKVSLLVGMHYENYEWRVMEVGEWHGTDLESELLPKEEPKEEQPGAAAATSTLRTLNTALITYASTYPDQGYPSALRALSGQENQEGTQDHAMLVDPSFLQEPAVKNGYQFRYIRISQESYQLTATPVLFNDGAQSFFTDDSAVIRVTRESRPATADDPPIE
ncbi:MAG TPA: hypothetical protein VIB39_11160 [Candidatus Angelobacter sp.]|jgi:hypothetical protein